MTRAIPLIFLCLLALPLPLRANPSLGDTISTIERNLSTRPESTAAGSAATERYIAGLVSASLDVFEQSRHLDAPYFGRSAGLDGRVSSTPTTSTAPHCFPARGVTASPASAVRMRCSRCRSSMRIRLSRSARISR
jgi:hypothetical protein